MMGRREGGQGQFFYSFDLDKVVPPDHLVRQIDGVLDLGWVHKELAPYYLSLIHIYRSRGTVRAAPGRTPNDRGSCLRCRAYKTTGRPD